MAIGRKEASAASKMTDKVASGLRRSSGTTGKIRIVVRGFRGGINEGPLFQFRKGQTCGDDRASLIHQLIGALDEKFSETETRKLLESIGGAHIEIIED